ncbi:hypothetical protein VKT23_012587 [Stygiomarasmius scandens]|uniref:F-box domain-containing protein n=1 Tax=Marasmiellus scandens TaxID=2682957 RepID=A0ABR1J5J4_9AGAR
MASSLVEPQKPVTATEDLPPEILDNVFYFYCEGDLPIGFHTILCTDATAKPYRSIKESPHPKPFYPLALTLSHVCSRWRDVALSDPSLWSRIELRAQLMDATDETISSLLSLIDLCLARSRESPLDFLIEFTDTFFQQRESVIFSKEANEQFLKFVPIYKLFVDHSHRWRNVHLFLTWRLCGDQWRDDVDVLIDWPRQFPILEELVVHNIGSHGDSSLLKPCMKILSAPRLRNVSNTGMGLVIKSEHPFHSLRSIMISDYLQSDILSLASSQTALTVRYIRGSMYLTNSGPVPCLANKLVVLVKADITAEGFIVTVHGALSPASFPNLTSFSLEVPTPFFPNLALLPPEPGADSERHDPSFWNRPVIKPQSRGFERYTFLTQCSPVNITHFSVINIRLQDEVLVQILSLLPLLSHLALADHIFREYRDPADHVAGAYNNEEWEEAEREWGQNPDESPLMLSRWFFRSLSFPRSFGARQPAESTTIPNLKELHVGFSRGQGRGGIFALLDMIESRRPVDSVTGLQFARIKLVSDENRDCFDSELYNSFEENLGLKEDIDEVLGDRLERLREAGMTLELDWTDTLREWRAGLGCWELK